MESELKTRKNAKIGVELQHISSLLKY